MRILLIVLVILFTIFSIESKKFKSNLASKKHNSFLRLLQPRRTTTSTTKKAIPVIIEGEQKKRQKFSSQDFFFDLGKSTPIATDAGERREVNVDVLPALSGQGVASVLFHLEPCAVNLPHIHPRGTELFFVVEGWFQASFLEENGGRLITNDVRKGQLTFFPRGLIHFEQNLSCERATFYSTFNSEDPGAITISNRLFDVQTNILTSSLNQSEAVVADLRSKLPINPAQGRGECLQRCGLI